jgi:hypothetical protein
MTFRGTVHDGKVLFDGDAALPEGTRVDIRPVRAVKKKAKKKGLARLARHAVHTGITDLTDEHDHYVYGTPKRGDVKRARKARKR